ncbi:hypothetical protein [Winogradskyella sp. 3972H.M.0a.05]|uniref:hypothetical protein n=1 Tax=Winogradskyella sp. 3972H.M.0a.05 TaxID=2950277 RepID=UPI0033953EC1
MKELITKQWNYRLSVNSSNEHILSVVCGTVGLYEVEVILTANQVEAYKSKGESMLDEIAEAIRKNPQHYS